MNKKPKLQDTLEVFIDEIDDVKKEFQRSKDILSILDKRIQELKDYQITVDVTELRKIQSTFLDDYAKKTNNLDSILKEHLQNTQDILSQQRNDRKSFFLFSFIFVIVLSFSIYLNINQVSKIDKASSKINILESNLNYLKGYINDTKQVENFNKWHKNKEVN